MRTRLLTVLLVAVVLVSFALVTSSNHTVSAQDDEMMLHVCDSTTILMLFIAEYEYGYVPMMDISTFELGQYAPLFDTMMMMADDMGDDMDDDMGDDMGDDTDMGDDMADDMMVLAPATIPDEDPACTELRTSVETFLYEHFAMTVGSDMMDEDTDS